jgi:hypothetical protein
MEPDSDEKAQLLTVRANVARSRLSAALSALDQRRRALLDIRVRVTEHVGLVRIVAVGCVAGLVSVAVYRAATATKRRRRERWRMLRRVWTHPELAAQPEESMLGKVGRALLVGAARYLVARLVAQSAVPGDEPSYRALTGG